ncbi:glycosyltransferase involved in cell wall biosynthesis [Neobacillus niacini]|uniref:glycosyltransferase family 2 protein n=1 Tax=Neobacillus niacini TaxID=86668 RepID=UPI0027843925|nr:glycosyltransferase family 2 protein [Neobacillus niacini]MDQ1000807.1 glycosyltransferase involved in cell wall biosynthesis [Neobacillus niacini]
MKGNLQLKISIAMCTYNGEEFIREQLDSFLNQTRLPDELIICDDRSNDNTIQIIKEFEKRAPFKVELIINEKQLGSTKNFEKALLHCRGDIIFLADQDDVWDKRKLSLIEEKFIENDRVGMVFTDAAMVDHNLNYLGNTLWESISFTPKAQKQFPTNAFDVFIRENVVTGATMAFRSKYTDMMMPFSEEWIHDAWMAIILAASKGILIEIIDKPLIMYRQHSNNQLGAVKRDLKKKIADAKTKKVMKNTQYSDVEEFLIQNKVNVKDNVLQMLKGKQKHTEHRNNLPGNFFKRTLKVAKEAGLLHYSKYSNGYRSIVKDILYK